jgi:uncharacterized hydrophobic protein (TIGR00271 family)
LSGPRPGVRDEADVTSQRATRQDEQVLHLRLVVPRPCADAVSALLVDDPRVTNVLVMPGASLDPPGDAMFCDVAREGASDVLGQLRGLGLDRDGTIAIEDVDASPGSPDDGVVWDVVLEKAYSDARASWSFYAFLTLATMIAGIAVVLDSSILVVGAMVVGPEFGAVTAIATGLVLRHRDLAAGGLRLLVQGFALAIAITVGFALVSRAGGWIDASSITAPRPLTGFIWKPDHWSFVVALLAGVAGTLSQTAGRSNALVGVFISVTTVPAAGNLALAIALWVPHEMVGAAAQLGINLTGMVVAGVITLVVQRLVWTKVPHHVHALRG